MINLHERMLPTSAGVEPATSWSPVGRRIQLSHRGRHWATEAGILFAGDKLYKYAKKNAKTYHDYLEPCDLPSYFSLDNQHYPWKVKKKKNKKKKKNIFRKFKYLILSGVSFPWFRDRTRYDFLIQPICSLHLQRLFYCIIGTRWLFLPFWVTCKSFRWNSKC